MQAFEITCSICDTAGPSADSGEEARCLAFDLGFERRGDGWLCRECAHEETLIAYCAARGLCDMPRAAGHQ